ncbi:DUF4214 domain-containing protein [Massilia solisilvae]|uniref:DUF4214 domain-containing protein n=1 Tax=Massilia solisilvae TaxID=1811225 RepID=A0ABT2BE25_9BURK|nr:DUF4214 domain-containing protein [Massilia solisilvae]MCS0606763.1 DUF4214 domain-containing protein [Massilia solisilvae]
MAIPTTTLGTTKPVENDLSIDSIPWGAPLLNNHTGVAVVWGVYGTTNLRVNLVSPGGTVGPTGYLLMGATMDANSSFHVAAAGPDRFVVLGDDGDDANPPFTGAYMRIFDTNGNTMSPTFSLGNYRYYDVKGVADGTFIVTWFNDDPGIQRFFYTHYTKDGNPIAGQTNKQFQAPTNVALLSVAGDASGGFMYSTPASTTSTDGSQLKYVDTAGNETLVTTVGAGYRGTLAYDGTNFWFFYVNSSQVYATKISGAGHTVIGNYTLTGFTSNQEPSVTMTPDGSFLLTDHPSTGNPKTVAKVSSAGTVLETYAIPSTDFVIVAPTTDNGALLVRNYAGSNGLYQLDVSESFESTYLDALPPTITTPAALSFVDTSANDTFTASANATLAITSDTAITGRGIQGGTTGISKTIGSVTYDVSKAGSYGTLYLKSSTGEYAYEPNNPAINALSANASDAFTVTANNANGSGTATLTVNITGVNDLPLVANLAGNSGTFKAGMANTIGDRIAPATVSVTDVDSANLAGGYLQINLTAGTNDGSFYADPSKVKGGTDSVLSPGDAVYVDVTGTGSSYVQIGTVAASGGVLHIDFNANATPANVTWLLKYLAYNSTTTGQRDFNLVLNDGDGGTSASYAFSMVGTDGTAPTLSSSSPADNATAVLTTVSPTIVFSEAVQFGTGKIYLVDVASNTVVEQFDVATAQGVGDGKVSISTTTLTINPTASLGYGKTYAIKIDSGAVTDLAGNAYAGISDNTTLNFTTNSAPPTVTISASPTSLKAGQHATITFTFSSVPTGFTAADISATGGTISALTVDGSDPKIYTADFAPNAAQSLSATIQINAGAFMDATSQPNVASNVLGISGDTQAPTITSITRGTPTGATTNADTLVFQVQFSEAVSNVDASDFSVSGTTATVSSVTSSGANSYSVTVSGGDLASLNGTVGLALISGNNVADSTGNALGSTSPTGANQGYTMDNAVAAPAMALASDTGSNASDGITKDGTINVTLAGDVASWEYSVDSGAHWTAGSGTSFTLAGGSYGAGAVQVRQTDVAGNLSSTASNAAAITVDTTAAAPSLALHSDTGASAADGITRNGSIDVTLPLDAASWEYSVDGGAHWTAGSATAFTLADNSYASGAVKVRYTDTAGNLSAVAANAATITVDNTVAAPALALAADTGTSNSDGLTKNTAVNVTLAADVASWEYSTDSGAHWTSGSGTSFNLADGTYAAGAVQVRQTDLAGNLSTAASNAAAITIDTAALAPTLALASDTGASAADGITKDGTVNVNLPLDVASWEYSVDGGAHWSAGSGGSFSLATGDYASGAVQTRYTDKAGNLSATGSNGAAITVDTSAPAPSFALAADTGTNNSDGITNNPTVNVTLPPDAASWEYSVDGGAHWTAGSGTSFNLPAGTQAVGQAQVRYTDLAGNLSAAGSNAAAITIDTSVAAPALALASDTGSSASDGITKDGAINVTLAGDVASWEYSVDSGAHWTAGSGTSFTLASGSYGAGAVQVRQTDIAGNLSSAASNAAAITVDTTAAAPSFALHSDTGASAADGITRNGTIDVALPGDAASWEYSVDGGAHWTAGSATAFTLADASYAAGAVKVRYTDTAGNLSAVAANAAAITIDNAVAAPTLTLAADTGTSNSDGLTKNTAVNVTLAADVASWEYSTDSGAHWTSGSSTSFNLADGTYAAGAVQVRQTDVAGNLSTAASNAAAITIDTSAAAPALALAADSGANAADGITKDGTINVTLPPDAASWEYSVDSGGHWSAGSGTSFVLAEGGYAAGAVQVRYTDNAGNLSAAASNGAVISVDHTVAAPGVALAADTGSSGADGLTNNATINVVLAGDAAGWEYSTDGGAHWTAGSGTSFVLPEGSYAAGTLQVRQTDLAGNLSPAAGNAAAITIDTTAAAPVIGLAADTGASASDGITANGQVNVTTAPDASSWEYSTDAGAHWAVGSGNSFVLGAGTWAGGTVQVRYTDKAGNLSAAASNAAAITVDLSAPAPTLALAQDNGASPTDGVTTNPMVQATLPADMASWEYSTDGGATWSTGRGVNFYLTLGKHVAGTVQVRYTDLAGNHSAAASNATDFFIERDAPPVTPPVKHTVDGVVLETSTVTNPDGSSSQVLVVPVVTPSRVDDTGSKAVADIPLVSSSDGVPVLTAQLPTGYGMQVAGSAGPQGPAASLAELTRDIQAHTPAGSAGQGSLVAAGASFLGELAPGSSLVVQSITPSVAPNGQPSAPVVIAAPPAAPNAPLTAVVIDSSNVPGGLAIQLQNVHFAALIGPMHVTGGDGSQVVFGDASDQYIVLGADDDVLHGGAGNDTVGSAGGNDRVYGDEGNDVVFGGEGNDYLDGGTGTDVVLLQGASRADYSLRFDHGNLVATQLHGGPDGTDTIANVEVLRFAGAHPDMGTDASLRRIYDTLFDRPADGAGAAWWSAAANHGMALHDIAANLLASSEAKGSAGLANAAFVDQLYRDALGTAPVPADERARWIGLLDQGKADRADVLLGIANGTQKLALDAQEHSDVAFADTDAATIVRLYQTVFGRHADEAGVNFWIGSSEAGMAMRDIVNAFLQSGEAQQRYGGTSDSQFVDTLYNVGFGRHADAGEIGYWTDKLHAGAISRADLVLYFADSPEQVTLVGNSTTIAGLTG